jgi:predicted dehydrogenase
VDRFATEGVLLTVFQNRRWDGDFLTVQRLVQESRLGSVHRFESRFERWRPELRGAWRESGDPADGGGLLLDLGSHLIDQALLLFGPVTGVYAEIDSRRSAHRADDDTFVAMTHASGVRSHLWMSALAGDPGPRFRVLGSRGAFVKRGLDVQEEALFAGARPGDPGWGEDTRDRWGAITAGVTMPVEVVPTLRGSYETFYHQLVHTVLRGDPPPVEPVSAVAPLDLIDAARLAAGGSGVV